MVARRIHVRDRLLGPHVLEEPVVLGKIVAQTVGTAQTLDQVPGDHVERMWRRDDAVTDVGPAG